MPKPATAPALSASATASGKAATGFLSSEVPMSEMPPAFDFGSKKAEIRVYSASDAAKLKPVGAAWSGVQKPDATAQRFPFSAEAGRCYRAVGSAGTGITDISVLILDSAGATAGRGHAEGGRVVAPEEGATCFREADHAVVVVSIGRGSGSFNVQLSSDK